MLALVLLGALIAHSTLGNSVENSYNTYPSYDSHSDTSASMGSRNGFEGSSERIENSDENRIATSTFGGSDANDDWVTYRPTQTTSAPLQHSTRSSSNTQDVEPQQIELELDVIHSMIANFVSRFNQPESTQQYKSSLNAAINVINKKMSELNYQALQQEPVQKRYQQLRTYFESLVTSIRLRLDYIEEELRLEAERQAETRRLEEIRLQEENERIQREQYLSQQPKQRNQELQEQQHQQQQIQQQQYQQQQHQQLQHQQQQHQVQQQHQLQQQQVQQQHQFQQHQRQHQQQQNQVQQQQQHQYQLQQPSQQQHQQQPQHQQQQQQHRYQQTQYPQISRSSVNVPENTGHTYSKAHIQSTAGGNTGIDGSYNRDRPFYQAPQSVTAPDLVATAIRFQQNLNRLQNEVFQFNSFITRLTSSNSASIISEAEATTASLQNRIDKLSETSRMYRSSDIYNHAAELGQRLQELFQNLKYQASSFNPQFSQSGHQYLPFGAYQPSPRYGSI